MSRPSLRWLALLLLFTGSACVETSTRSDSEDDPLVQERLYRAALPAEFVIEQGARLAEAKARLAEDPSDVESWIWTGRRQGYLGRFRDAIATYSRAIERTPADPRLYRHRGHRWISVREFERAIADLELARDLMIGRPDEIEPDGLPNALGVPTSTLHTNVYYHLALAHFFRGEFERARSVTSAGLSAAKNPDMKSAMGYWHCLTLWRLGTEAEARLLLATIDPEWLILENEDYHELLRSFAGDRDPLELLPPARESGGVRLATVGYGVGAWLWHQGRRDEARALWREVVEHGPWSAFGTIAAEVELAATGDQTGDQQ